MNQQPKLTCPNCENEDDRMIEVVEFRARRGSSITVYLCFVCSKEFEVRTGKDGQTI